MLILLLPERIDLALHQVAVVLAIGIVCAQLQRGLVGLYRLGPLLQGFLRGSLFGLLSRAIQRIAEVVVSVLLVGQALRIARWRAADRLLECLCGLRKLSCPVCGGTGVELQYRLFGSHCRRLAGSAMPGSSIEARGGQDAARVPAVERQPAGAYRSAGCRAAAPAMPPAATGSARCRSFAVERRDHASPTSRIPS